jgi:hypothetical protein
VDMTITILTLIVGPFFLGLVDGPQYSLLQ